MKFIATTPLDAWLQVSRHLINTEGHEAFNLLIEFSDISDADEAEMLEFDPRSLGSKYDLIKDVANTIFPQKIYTNSTSRSELYQRYLRAHKRSRRRRWGTYFQRFICFGNKEVNQLENIVHALSTRANTYKAAYMMHTSSAETDGLRTRGNPCLQYVQFNCPNQKQLDLVAVYRNHDYYNKALGNFVGLSRLLKFVANESGHTIGSVTCLSIHAYADAPISLQKQLAKL